MLKPGLRVVRGPNWSLGKEDGGEGFVGTLREINTVTKTAIVQWDNGNQIQCRVGYLDRYDIRIVDNAQIGVTHKRVICDECDSNYISGMRYKCMNCNDFDLCFSCYHGGKHDLRHRFRRFETPQSLGIILPPRLSSRKCELKGIFRDASVIRGVDWAWRNQDGGPGKLGIVLDIRGWQPKSYRSVAQVQWLEGNTDSYRLGHKGYCDIQFVEASSGGFYYPEHLPILGQTEEQMEFNQILDAIEIEQVREWEMKTETMEVNKVSDEIKKWEMEKHSTLVQLGSVESTYTAKVIDYNFSIIREQPKINLVNEFSKMVCELRNDEVKEMWEMLKYMSQLPEISSSENVVNTRYSETVIDNIVENGKKYLENRYKNYMITEVNTNNSQSSMRDLPQTYQLVHNFVGTRLQGEYVGLQDTLIDDRPLWAMVYYCLRIGDLNTAIFYLECSPQLFKDILSVLKAQLNPPAVPVLEESIRMSYSTTVRNESDPFKRAVWAYLGRCNELSEVIKTADDYLWFNLHVHNGVNQYTNLQNVILENGETHYDAFNKPLLYFKLLVLTGQFEAAIDFVFRTEQFKIEAVHMAIALNEMNLLSVSENNTLPLISLDPKDPKPARRLNLALLLRSYVNKFEKTCLNAALHYFFMLRNCSDSKGKNLFKLLVSDLAVSTKEYERLFGKMHGGTKTLGLVDQFKNTELTVGMVADFLIKMELYEEAIDLYDAVNDMEGVLGVMCLLLPKVAHLENRVGSLRNRFEEKIIIFEEKLSKDIPYINQHLVSSFTKFKGILRFFDLYRAREFTDALMELSNIGIVPLKVEEMDEKLEYLKNFSEDFCNVLPHILLATMTILLDQCDKIKKNKRDLFIFVDSNHLPHVRRQANCIINFAERLPRKIMGNITNKLAQMMSLMHP